MRILLVEDSRTLADLMLCHLQSNGHKVHYARNGELAVAYAETFDYDAVITDAMMPGVSGVEFLKNVQADKKDTKLKVSTKWHDKPIVVLTAAPTTEIREIKQQLKDFSRLEVMQKPQSFNSVIEKLESLCHASV